MPDAAEKFAEAAKAAGWSVGLHRGMASKATFTVEEAPEDSKDKATRTRGDDVEVPIVIVRARRGAQTVWAKWRDGKSVSATCTAPLRMMTVTEATRLVRESHEWPCRWLPTGTQQRPQEICEAHGDVRDR